MECQSDRSWAGREIKPSSSFRMSCPVGVHVGIGKNRHRGDSSKPPYIGVAEVRRGLLSVASQYFIKK